MKELAVDIAEFLHHLENCPAGFLKLPVCIGGEVHTNALLLDVYRQVHGNMQVNDDSLPEARTDSSFTRQHLLSVQVGCWFFAHPVFKGKNEILAGMQAFLFSDLDRLSPYVPANEWVSDEERAEEFIRLALITCGFLPGNETAEEAIDRLEALDTLKRRAVLRESNAAMQRIKEIRQKMAEEKAREAANVYGRE